MANWKGNGIFLVEGNLDYSLKRLRLWFHESGLARELKRKDFFQTRTQQRRVKDKLARKRFDRAMRKQAAFISWRERAKVQGVVRRKSGQTGNH